MYLRLPHGPGFTAAMAYETLIALLDNQPLPHGDVANSVLRGTHPFVRESQTAPIFSAPLHLIPDKRKYVGITQSSSNIMFSAGESHDGTNVLLNGAQRPGMNSIFSNTGAATLHIFITGTHIVIFSVLADGTCQQLGGVFDVVSDSSYYAAGDNLPVLVLALIALGNAFTFYAPCEPTGYFPFTTTYRTGVYAHVRGANGVTNIRGFDAAPMLDVIRADGEPDAALFELGIGLIANTSTNGVPASCARTYVAHSDHIPAGEHTINGETWVALAFNSARTAIMLLPEN